MGQNQSLTHFKLRRPNAAKVVSVAEKLQAQAFSTPEGDDHSEQQTVASNKAVDWTVNDPDNRRAYHKVENSIYILPEEESEQKRLMIQSNMLAMAFGSNIVTPEIQRFPNKARKILDVGCASGFWLDSLFFGGNLSSDFHGVDITEEPSSWGTVCGAKIAAGNVLDGLPYADGTFDYVHQRALVLGVPKEKWPEVVQELVRVTKPGGWIELVEPTLILHNAGPTAKLFNDKANAALGFRGVDIDLVETLPEYVSTCKKLKNVGHRVVEIPLNWGGDIGQLQAHNVRTVTSHASDFLKLSLGIDDKEFSEMLDTAVSEWSEAKSYIKWIGVWGQVSAE
ncbi:hypothetical protein HDU84_006816 [Entophlyctis sp. JEL0112]|nr:hypothetical protein HDU84_006816 [Entophlyctis sp. JEL0112]